MEEQDKASTLIPESPAQKTLAKIDARDKVIRLIELTIVFALVVFNLFVGLRLQNVIDQNQAASLQRSHEAQTDRDSIKSYIKCVLLIRFNNDPQLLVTKQAVSAALDTCAKQE